MGMGRRPTWTSHYLAHGPPRAVRMFPWCVQWPLGEIFHPDQTCALGLGSQDLGLCSLHLLSPWCNLWGTHISCCGWAGPQGAWRRASVWVFSLEVPSRLGDGPIPSLGSQRCFAPNTAVSPFSVGIPARLCAGGLELAAAGADGDGVGAMHKASERLKVLTGERAASRYASGVDSGKCS